MSSSAQHDLYDEMYNHPPAHATTGTENAAAMRRIAAERLAAHRNRRGATDAQALASAKPTPVISAAAQRVRDAVAARYQQAPTFREFMEAHPTAAPVSPIAPWIEEPVHVAQPIAVVSAFEEETPVAMAAEIAEPVQQSYAAEAPEMEAQQFEAPAFFTHEPLAQSMPFEEPVLAAAPEDVWDWPSNAEPFDGDLEVRHYAYLPQPQPLPERSYAEPAAHPEELEGLEEEIEFRLAPEFVEHYIEPLPIQANVIEFPRQLVATKKARPRLAEGPLRSDEEAAPATPAHEEMPQGFQMRIFEVEDPLMAQVAEPAILEEAEVLMEAPALPAAPEWQELVLETPKPSRNIATREDHHEHEEEARLEEIPVATLELRVMSSVVDGVCIAGSLLLFVSISLWMSGNAAEIALKELSLPLQVAAAVSLLAGMALIYQAVFFSLGAATLGMSYAGLEFLTLSGRKPSRGMVRRRLGANVLAVAPLGIGLLWSLIDRQKLGWNDRMSGIFLREI